jgi:hypothetical protein
VPTSYFFLKDDFIPSKIQKALFRKVTVQFEIQTSSHHQITELLSLANEKEYNLKILKKNQKIIHITKNCSNFFIN